MFRVLSCLTYEHNWSLVAVAATICFISSYCFIATGRQAAGTRGAQRLIWIAVAACAAGFGIWSTHFIAMLAYDPGVVAGYDLGLTVLSLSIAIVLTASGLALALEWKAPPAVPAGGALVGVGVSAMHYLGMAALEMPARIVWAPDLVAASLLLGALFGAFALMVARRYQSGSGDLGATLLLTLAICLMHFTAMGAVTVVPDPTRGMTASTLDPQTMAYSLAVAAIALIGGALIVARITRLALAEKRASERRFGLLVDGVTDYAIFMIDRNGCVANWNGGAQRMLGYASEEIVGAHVSRFFSAADRSAKSPEAALTIAESTGRHEEEGWRRRKDGSRFWAHVAIDAIRDDAGDFVGFAEIIRDCTREKADADRIREVGRTLDLALSNMSQGLCLFAPTGQLVLTNGRLAELFGLAPADLVPGTPFEELLKRIVSAAGGPADEARQMYLRHRDLIAGRGRHAVIEEFSTGRSVSIAHRTAADGSFVTTFEDVTERRRSEQKIAYMARHDALTGLPNRAHFNDYLDQELVRLGKSHDRAAVVGIDLDRFKEINDVHGHATGDDVLQILSRRMQEILGEGEFVARFGGDEFAAVKTYRYHADLIDFLERLERCLFSHIKRDEFDIVPGASIGVALFPDDGTTREVLINNADLAMYRSKAGVNQTICFYEARMDEVARSRRALAKDLWLGLERKQFSLAYQVQKSVSTGKTVGYEVLLRWQHPERGMVAPGEFIPIAEECGAIVPLGEWVLRTACAEAASWLHPYKIAVNLSPVQIGHVDLVGLVREVLADTGLKPQLLELEITETTIIADKERALHVLRQVKELGVTIAIDDFGTGYSSLDTLRSFPFDKIKLDRTFMTELETSPQAKAIIRAILALGRSLEVPVLAEGVETQDQLSLLHVEGCDEAQGYLLGRPQPHADFVEMIRNTFGIHSPPLAPAPAAGAKEVAAT